MEIYYKLRQFYKSFISFCYWGWKLRNNRNYDMSELYYLIYLKLKKCEGYFLKYGHLCWNENKSNKLMRKLRIAKTIAERLDENNYETNRKKIEEKYGELKRNFLENNVLEIYYSKCKTKEEKRKVSILSRNASILDEKQRQSEKKYLFKLLNKYIDVWWD